MINSFVAKDSRIVSNDALVSIYFVKDCGSLLGRWFEVQGTVFLVKVWPDSPCAFPRVKRGYLDIIEGQHS